MLHENNLVQLYFSCLKLQYLSRTDLAVISLDDIHTVTYSMNLNHTRDLHNFCPGKQPNAVSQCNLFITFQSRRHQYAWVGNHHHHYQHPLVPYCSKISGFSKLF